MKTSFHKKSIVLARRHSSVLVCTRARVKRCFLIPGALHTDAKRSWDLLVLEFVRGFKLVGR